MYTCTASLAAVSLSSNLANRATSDTSGGKLAIRSRTTASLEAEFSNSINALISSSGSGGSPRKQYKIKKVFFLNGRISHYAYLKEHVDLK